MALIRQLKCGLRNLESADMFVRDYRTRAKSFLYKMPKNVAIDKGLDPIKIEPSAPKLYFENQKELETADERIKKILSVEFANKNDLRLYEDEQVRKMFGTDELERDSLEIQIALHTIRIRRCENIMKIHPRNNTLQMLIYRAIYRRERYLKQLRETNYDRYMWVKEKLGLEWEPMFQKEHYSTRYGQFKMDVKAKARQERENKINELKMAFNEKKDEYYANRQMVFQSFYDDLKSLGFNEDKLNEFKAILEK